MNLSYEKQMTIALAQSLVQKYGAMLSDKDFSEILGIKAETIGKKVRNMHNDLPKYTQLRGKRVFMASDIAEWMVSNNLKFPK